MFLKDTNAKVKAIRDIEDNSNKMEREKTKVDEYEASLVAEEKILEGIRDSLKGTFCPPRSMIVNVLSYMQYSHR